ncbi:hypothetical protein [Liquorilactobacillus sucicola]|uniref:hypothetical protein n=1 Tax=Liquorilactobacillus sucicola TaxID=519050 RepID=UPI0034E1FE55
MRQQQGILRIEVTMFLLKMCKKRFWQLYKYLRKLLRLKSTWVEENKKDSSIAAGLDFLALKKAAFHGVHSF